MSYVVVILETARSTLDEKWISFVNFYLPSRDGREYFYSNWLHNSYLFSIQSSPSPSLPFSLPPSLPSSLSIILPLSAFPFLQIPSWLPWDNIIRSQLLPLPISSKLEELLRHYSRMFPGCMPSKFDFKILLTINSSYKLSYDEKNFNDDKKKIITGKKNVCMVKSLNWRWIWKWKNWIWTWIWYLHDHVLVESPIIWDIVGLLVAIWQDLRALDILNKAVYHDSHIFSWSWYECICSNLKYKYSYLKEKAHIHNLKGQALVVPTKIQECCCQPLGSWFKSFQFSGAFLNLWEFVHKIYGDDKKYPTCC